jgi:hypothetical protein
VECVCENAEGEITLNVGIVTIHRRGSWIGWEVGNRGSSFKVYGDPPTLFLDMYMHLIHIHLLICKSFA